MSEIPAKLYVNSGLFIGPNEVNPWLIATKYYTECVDRWVNTFPSKKDLLEELKRSDINTVCKKELGYLRELAPTIRYKEVLGSQQYLFDNPFLEELDAKYKK